jgi:hypothetical protein
VQSEMSLVCLKEIVLILNEHTVAEEVWCIAIKYVRTIV